MRLSAAWQPGARPWVPGRPDAAGRAPEDRVHVAYAHLQAIIKLLRDRDLGIAIQFTNYLELLT